MTKPAVSPAPFPAVRTRLAAPEFEIVRGGFATAYAATAGRPIQMSGCLYRADGTKVALSERASGHRGDHVRNVNPDRLPRPADAAPLPGRGLYLGHYMIQYGHFLSETLSTFWVFETRAAADFDYFLFHPFTFGTSVPDFVRLCFARFAIDPARVVLVGGTARALEEVAVPQRLLELNHWADPRLGRVHRRIAAAARRPEPPARRVYLSRRRISARKFNRAVVNEVRIEALFRQHGFEILYPEATGFADQLSTYANAAILAGLSGSALHNSLFLPEGARLIELGDPRYGGRPAPNQALCDQLAGVRSSFIPFRGRLFGARHTMLFDMGYLAERLRAALADAPPAGAGAPATGARLRDLGEIAYLGARCLLGEMLDRVRQLLRRKA